MWVTRREVNKIFVSNNLPHLEMHPGSVKLQPWMLYWQKRPRHLKEKRVNGSNQIMWGCGGIVVSTRDFRSEGRWFDAQSLPSCCFLRQETLPHFVSLDPGEGGKSCNGLASHLQGGGEVGILSVASCCSRVPRPCYSNIRRVPFNMQLFLHTRNSQGLENSLWVSVHIK